MLQLWDVLRRPRKQTKNMHAPRNNAFAGNAFTGNAFTGNAFTGNAFTNLFFSQTLASCAPAYSCHGGHTICTALPLQAVPLQALLRRPHFHAGGAGAFAPLQAVRFCRRCNFRHHLPCLRVAVNPQQGMTQAAPFEGCHRRHRNLSSENCGAVGSIWPPFIAPP